MCLRKEPDSWLPRYGEKTPGNCEHLKAIGDLLPEAHFVHVIRDGRDVALSLRPMCFANPPSSNKRLVTGEVQSRT